MSIIILRITSLFIIANDLNSINNNLNLINNFNKIEVIPIKEEFY